MKISYYTSFLLIELMDFSCMFGVFPPLVNVNASPSKQIIFLHQLKFCKNLWQFGSVDALVVLTYASVLVFDWIHCLGKLHIYLHNQQCLCPLINLLSNKPYVSIIICIFQFRSALHVQFLKLIDVKTLVIQCSHYVHTIYF